MGGAPGSASIEQSSPDPFVARLAALRPVPDPETVGEGAPLAEPSQAAAPPAQVLALQQRLQHERDQRVVDVDAEAGVETVAEVQVLVRQPVGPELPGRGNAPA